MNQYGTVIAPRTVRFERSLPGPIERVWDHLVDSEKRGRWLARGTMDLRPGGEIHLVFHNTKLTGGDAPPPAKYADFGGEVRMTGRVIESVPPRKLVFSWAENFGDASEVTFELAPHGNRVLLTVTHRKLGSRDEMISVAGGWHTHLDILADRLEGRTSPPFWPTDTSLESEYDRTIPRD